MENQDLFNRLMDNQETPKFIRKELNLTPHKYHQMLEVWTETKRLREDTIQVRIEENKTELKNLWWRLNEVINLLKEKPKDKELNEEFNDLKLQYANKTIWEGINSSAKNESGDDNSGNSEKLQQA